MFHKRAMSNTRYFWILIGIGLIYLITQWYYIHYAIFSMDDFWLAYHTNEYQSGLPYRDFFPYKSVLGYYVYLFPMWLFQGPLSSLWYTKVWIAFINSLFLVGISFWLKKFFDPKAILTTVILIICTPLFFLYSSEIRVDVLAYWMCLISVLFLFDKKYWLAGISLGLAFLICQKAVLYIVATNCALMGHWFVHDRSWKMVRRCLSLQAGMFGTIILYILFWSYFSSIHTVLRSMFYEPYLIYGIDWYHHLVEGYWSFIISNSLELIFLCPLALFGLMVLSKEHRVFIGIYTVVILCFIVSCKQPFVYFPLVALPAFFVLFPAFFSALYPYFQQTLVRPPLNTLLIGILLFVGFGLGVLRPIMRSILLLPGYDGSYQRSVIYAMANLLSDDDSYIAGVPLLRHIPQSVPGLKHLVGPAIAYMTHPSQQLFDILTIPSLYFTPVTAPEIIQSIKRAPIKLYVDNNRFHYIPKDVFRYLDTQYQHYWGSIYLYAPKIQGGHHVITIKFKGHYRVQSDHLVFINSKKMKPHSIVLLNKGQYDSNANGEYRLVLTPDQRMPALVPLPNDWKKMLGR